MFTASLAFMIVAWHYHNYMSLIGNILPLESTHTFYCVLLNCRSEVESVVIIILSKAVAATNRIKS